MDKTCYIQQPAGLGDILFCQKIAYRAINDFGCNKVIWPVSYVYGYLSDYIFNDKVIFDPQERLPIYDNKIINNENFLYIPLQTCDNLVPYHDSRANGHIKYKFFYDTDYLDWKNYFTLKRNLDRELKLVKLLNIDISKPYNFINPSYGTPPGHVKNNNIKPNNEFPNVYMEIIPNVNIFDWLTIIENAKEIHTVETSLYYILEKLNIEDNVYIYSKYKHSNPSYNDDYEYMKSHCSKKWNYT